VLRQTHGWSVVVSVTPFSPEQQMGLPPVYEERLHRLGIEVVDSGDDHSNIDVCFFYHASERIPSRNNILHVQLPPSLISKGLRFGSAGSAIRDNLADVQFVPGEWHTERMRVRNEIFVPIESVGLPGLDPILGNWVASRESLQQQLSINPQQQSILYAPTWNPELSSVPLLWTRIRQLASPDQVLILRPHPYASDDYQQACEALAKNEENIRLAREPDIQPYLHVADLVVSDTSSLAWEAAVLDKPVVRIDTQNRSEYNEFDPSDPEYVFADIGPVVNHIDDLRKTVIDQLSNPDQFHTARMAARDALIARTNGTSCKQVLELVTKRLAGQSTGWQPEISGVQVVLDAHEADLDTIERSLKSLFECSREEVHVRLIRADHLPESTLQSWNERWSTLITRIENSKAALQTNLPFMLLLKAGTIGNAAWLFRLVNHLRRHPQLAMIAPMAFGGRPVQDPRVRMQQSESLSDCYEHFDELLRLQQAGQMLDPDQAPSANSILIRTGNSSATAIASAWLQQQWPESGEKVPIGIAADVVLHFSAREFDATDLPASLSNGMRTAAEERVRELSQWIQRTMPAHVRSPQAAPTQVGSEIPLSDSLPGPLRLATRYLEQGKVDRARDLLNRAKVDLADHPQTRLLLDQLESVSVSGEAGS